jgi:hypothetical protein
MMMTVMIDDGDWYDDNDGDDDNDHDDNDDDWHDEDDDCTRQIVDRMDGKRMKA